MAKRQVYSFVERKHSANGIASAVMSIASVLVLLFLLLLSFLWKGMAAEWIGAVGIAGILLACFSLYYGFAGFKDESKSYICSKIGTVLGTMAIIAWFFIVCIGVMQA